MYVRICSEAPKEFFRNIYLIHTDMNVFNKIGKLAFQIRLLAELGKTETIEKHKDQIMEEIIKRTEKIDQLYSINWH